MYTIVLALTVGLLAGEAFHVFEGAVFRHAKVWEAIAVGVTVGLVAGVLLLRRAGARVEPLMKAVEKHVLGGRRELALKALRAALPLGRWNPLIPSQLQLTIGVLEYAGGDLDAAQAALVRAPRSPWMSRAYLGCVYFRKREPQKMKAAFDVAVKAGAKEGVLYTLYAYCLLAQGKRPEAVAVIETGLKKIPGDHRLEANLELAREGKKLKVAPYGDDFSRFALDGVPAVSHPDLPRGMRGYNPRPGFRQRSQKRR